MSVNAIKMAHVKDPKEEILDRVRGLVESVHIVNPFEALIAIYKRPERTASGLYLEDRTRQEDIWQGKVGLVLAKGPMAFTPDDNHAWPDRVPQVGDWVAFRVGDSWQLSLGKQPCRMVEDRHFRLIVDSPDLIY